MFPSHDNEQLGDWDFEILSAEFGEFDLDELGLDLPEIEETTKIYDKFKKDLLTNAL